MASLAEGLTWIERSGLDREKALTVLKSGAPGSPLLGAISARMVSQNYAVNFLLNLMTKDLLYAQNEAAHYDVDLKTAEVARSLFEAAIAQGLGNEDMSSVIEPLRNKRVQLSNLMLSKCSLTSLHWRLNYEVCCDSQWSSALPLQRIRTRCRDGQRIWIRPNQPSNESPILSDE